MLLSSFVDFLKVATRAKHEKGIRQHVIVSALIPGNWNNLIRVELNKQELFNFLSKALIQSFDEDNKELVVTNREQVPFAPPQQDI